MRIAQRLGPFPISVSRWLETARTPSRFLGFLGLFLCAPAAFATTYITLPTDRELIGRSGAIVTGTVEGSYVQRGGSGGFETIYEVRVQRSLKGDLGQDELVRVASPGGEMGRFGSYTPGAAHFANGEKALLFLSGGEERWTVTEMALGSWRFGKSLEGERLLVRDLAEVETFDRGGNPEPLRSEPGFLRFIGEVVAGAPAVDDYLVRGREAPREPIKRNLRPAGDSLADPRRYTQMSGSLLGVRWSPTGIGSGLNFYKHATSNLSGAGDGGVSVIQNGLASWTNDSTSAVTLTYAGTQTNAPGATTGGNPAYAGFADGLNIVQFNADLTSLGSPAGIASIVFWTTDTDGSAGAGYREIIDADIRISSSLSSGSPGLPTIITHELGHTIGFRHSNATPASPNDSATTCALPDDCVSNENGAIMMWRVVNAGNGYVLQPWDTRAVSAVYPGASTLAAPTNVVATATSDTSVTVTWTPVDGATGYQVDRSAGNNVWEQIGTPAGPPFASGVPFSNFSYLYRVRATNGATVSANSAADYATAFVFTDAPLVAGSTPIRGLHVGQLRMAVNYVRNLAGLTDFAFTDPTIFISVTAMKAVHITELRTAINQARTTMGFPALSFTDGTLTAGVTGIKIAHIHDLRGAVQ